MTGRGYMPVSESDVWGSPTSLVEQYGPFDLDPAACEEFHAAPAWYGEADDGLFLPWFGRVWLNPPFGHRGGLISRWLLKAVLEVRLGRAASVTALLPAKTSTAWWHEFVVPFARVEFLRGRLTYRRPAADPRPAVNAPFASAIVVYVPDTCLLGVGRVR